MENLPLQIIRSRRKTFGMQLGADGLTVRAPLGATDRQIRDFITAHRGWIQKRLSTWQPVVPLSPAQLSALTAEAKAVIPARVRHYAPLVGVTYGRITIRHQRSRWGSCSAAGNLNFNCLLLLAPPEVLDSVVVHELCHRKEMNHSPRFYAEVQRVFPAYRTWAGWLRQNGAQLLRRLPPT